MSDERRVAHSLAEVYLYLLATPCPACGKGPLEGTDPEEVEEAPHVRMTVTARCRACHAERAMEFALPEGKGTDADGGPPVFNPTDAPSEIVDVAQWIVLFGTITEAAGRESDRQQARRLGLEAAQCLDEALKFFTDPESDVPPPEAFRLESSKARFREHPQFFSRQRLIGLRGKLPALSKMRSRVAQSPDKPRRWWRPGR